MGGRARTMVYKDFKPMIIGYAAYAYALREIGIYLFEVRCQSEIFNKMYVLFSHVVPKCTAVLYCP